MSGSSMSGRQRRDRTRLLEQIAEFASEGRQGAVIRELRQKYAALPRGLPVFAACLDDYALQSETLEEELVSFRDMILKLLVVCHRDSRTKAPSTAEAFVLSLIHDYPGAAESALTQKWSNLIYASLALRECATETNRIMIWQQMKELVQASNEFLDGLLGFLIPMWRAALGKSVNPRVFGCAYGDRVNQFRDLTGGDEGAFGLILRLAQPQLRNAIAHGGISLDEKTNVVHCVTGTHEKSQWELSFTRFAALATLGSHLAASYLGAIATIVLLQSGDAQAVAAVPMVLRDLWRHHPEDDRLR